MGATTHHTKVTLCTCFFIFIFLNRMSSSPYVSIQLKHTEQLETNNGHFQKIQKLQREKNES